MIINLLESIICMRCMSINCLCICLVYIDIIVNFSQSLYNIGESIGPAQPVLVLSNPSSTNITVQVRSNDTTATGE